jgi:hypothetical protein
MVEMMFSWDYTPLWNAFELSWLWSIAPLAEATRTVIGFILLVVFCGAIGERGYNEVN